MLNEDYGRSAVQQRKWIEQLCVSAPNDSVSEESPRSAIYESLVCCSKTGDAEMASVTSVTVTAVLYGHIATRVDRVPVTISRGFFLNGCEILDFFFAM